MLEIGPGRWEGLDGLGEAMLHEIRGEAEDTVLAVVIFFSGEIKTTLSGGRHGRSYVVSRTGRLHVASAPGEAPASLTGNLRNSIGYSLPVWEGWTVSAEVGVGLGTVPSGGAQDPAKTYARRLEWGGAHVTRKTVRVQLADGWITVKAGTVIRILPRPYMEPTAVRVEPEIARMMDRGMAA